MQYFSLFIGFTSIIFAAGILHSLFRFLTVEVEDETEEFIISMGQVSKVLNKPGLHFVPEKIFPWVHSIRLSKQIDFRTFKNIQVSDHFGTTVTVDLWIEFRISSPYKALFSVENWEEALKSLIVHSTASILSSQTVNDIIKQRTELADQLKLAASRETERWGITISNAMIQNVGLLPEISKKFFNSVAAKIERTKALIEEEGRLKVAKLDADTHYKVAELNGLAKAQLAMSIGSAYGKLSADPRLLKAFQDYWDMMHLDPRRTVTFDGFSPETINAVEASVAIESLINH